MTDKQLKMSIERVLLPEYEQMIPPLEQHEFSAEFEQQMSELIAEQKTRRRQKHVHEKKTARVRSARWQPFVSAAAVLVIAFAAVILILSKSEQIDTSHKPSVAAQQSSSHSDTDGIGLKQLEFANQVAADMLNEPDKYYARSFSMIGTDYNNCVTHTQTESLNSGKPSEAAKALGDCLIYRSIIRYHGTEMFEGDAADKDKSEYQLFPAGSTVDSETLNRFNDMKSYLMICTKQNAKLFSNLDYTNINGTGYLRIVVNDHEAHKMQRLYFSFTVYDRSADVSTLNLMNDWETSESVSRQTVDKADFLAMDGNQTKDPFGSGFKYTIDNSGSMPVVNITELDLTENEQLQDAEIQISLCKKGEYESEPIEAATIKSSLKKGSYDFSQYSSAISKQDICGIKIKITYNTSSHPAPVNNNFGFQTAYKLEVYLGE